eukprot:3382915-Alexandrium_andersonii.AAC.1
MPGGGGPHQRCPSAATRAGGCECLGRGLRHQLRTAQEEVSCLPRLEPPPRRGPEAAATSRDSAGQ